VRWTTPIIALGFLAVIGVAILFGRSDNNIRTMKDGRRLHLNSLTFTEDIKIEVRDPNVTVFSRMRAALWREPRPIANKVVRKERWGAGIPAVWLEIERKKGEPFRARSLRVEIHLPNGQILGTRFSGGSWFALGNDLYQGMLPSLPTTIESLDLRILADDESFQFKVKNPAFLKRPAEAALQTLPHTEARGDLVARLEGFAVKSLSHETRNERGYNFWVSPKFQLWWNGSPADDWFDKSVLYANATGRFSSEGWVFGETFWKVRITVQRNAKFPRIEGEELRLESTNVALGEGEIRELAVPTALSGTWPRAVLLGSGSYALTSEGPVICEMDRATHWSKGALSPDVASKGIALLLIGSERDASSNSRLHDPFDFVARDDRDRQLQRFNNQSILRANRFFSLTQLSPLSESKGVRFTFFGKMQETFEYSVAPPSLPR
jgi:hypothetical protein